MDWAPFQPQTIKRSWPGLRAGSYLLPPYEGFETTEPDSIEVIFSGHRNVAVEFGSCLREIALAPGTTLVRGAEPINWLRVSEYSDSIVMYPDMALLQKLAREANAGPIELEPIVLGHDPVMLAVAHIMRRGCTAGLHISDIKASSLAHLLIRRLLSKQYGIEVQDANLPAARMDDRSVDAIGDLSKKISANASRSRIWRRWRSSARSTSPAASRRPRALRPINMSLRGASTSPSGG